MPTDAERREAARRLRELADYCDENEMSLSDDDWPGILSDYIWSEDSGYHTYDEDCRRIADLIEPNRGSGGRAILCAHCENVSWCVCEPGDEEGGCDFEPSVTEGEPPYNLYSLYEAVLRRHPRDEDAIDDDEVEELVDALLDICNAPGHEHIQRLKPPNPDATASYKGWRAKVYDPDGALASPSNTAADLVRAHADGKGPGEQKVRCVAEVKVDGEQLEKLAHDAAVELAGIDRDALLSLADDLEGEGLDGWASGPVNVGEYARRVREALGMES